MNLTKEQLAGMIDHTNLKAYADDAAIAKLCEEARRYSFKAVAINGAQIERCAKYLAGSNVHIGSTVGFPLGQMTVESKVFETMDAIRKGAHEIDYVLNVAELKNGNTDLIEDGDNGFLYSPADAHGFSEGIRKLAGDAELRRRFSDRSKERIKAFSLEEVTNAICSIYRNELFGEKTASGQ